MDRYRTVVIETRQRELLRDAEQARWAARIRRRAGIGRVARALRVPGVSGPR